MDREDRRINFFIAVHAIIFVVWTILSTIVYGIVCITTSAFSPRWARKIGRIWNVHLLSVGGVKVKVRGAEKLDKNKTYIFVVNHQSALDIPVLYAGMNHSISFIAKKELFSIPMFGWGMTVMGHIWIDRSNARSARESILRAIDHLHKARTSLVLFPEGTRSVDGVIGDFKTGSFSLALQAKVQIVPVVLHDTRLCLPKSATMLSPGIVHMDICDPVAVNENEMTKADLSNKIRDIICRVAAEGPQKD